MAVTPFSEDFPKFMDFRDWRISFERSSQRKRHQKFASFRCSVEMSRMISHVCSCVTTTFFPSKEFFNCRVIATFCKSYILKCRQKKRFDSNMRGSQSFLSYGKGKLYKTWISCIYCKGWSNLNYVPHFKKVLRISIFKLVYIQVKKNSKISL